MWCPLCYRKLINEEFHPADGDVQAHWLCVDCDCRVDSWDDEFEWPEPAGDAPQEAG